MAVSPESRAFMRSFATLSMAINNPHEVAMEAFSAGIVSAEVLQQVSMAMQTTSQKAGFLLCIVNQCIAARPEIFHQFVTILKKYPYLQGIATQVEHHFRDCQIQQAMPMSIPTPGVDMPFPTYFQQATPLMPYFSVMPPNPLMPWAPFGALSLPRFPQGNQLTEVGIALKSTYRLKPEIPVDCWPPVKKTHYINLALLSSDPADIKDDFVRHTLRGTLDDILKDKEQIEFSEVFSESHVPLGSRIILQGRPGSGKTTLMNKITQEWSKGKILNNIKVLFLVPLRSFYGKDDISLKDILEACVRPDKVETLYQYIYECQGSSVCFAIDGLDEYSPSSKKQDFIHELIRGHQLPQSLVIVASRPAATQKFRRLATRNIEVLGFLQPQISSYVSDYYASDSSKAEELLAFLENHPNVHHMCYLPLHAAMIACLYDRMGSSLPDTETEIYRHFTLYILIRAMSQLEDRFRSDSDVYLENFEALPSEQYDVFTAICQLAFNATIEKRQIFNHCEVRDSFQLRKGLDTERSLGLIRIDRHQLLYGHTDTCSFLHLTFQEFLAAIHMTRLGVEEQTECIEQHSTEQHMNVVWKFFCGLTKLRDESALRCFSKILEHSANSLLHVHCAYESQSEIACKTLVFTNSGAVKVHKQTLSPSDMTAIMFVAVKAQEPLNEIRMTSCHIGKEGFYAAVKELSGQAVQLRCLNVGGTKLSNERCEGFASFLDRFQYSELRLGNCGLQLKGFTDVLSRVFASVEVLSLHQNNSLRVKAREALLEKVQHLNTLRKIEIDSSLLEPRDINAVFSNCPTLMSVKLWEKKSLLEVNVESDTVNLRITKEIVNNATSLMWLLEFSSGFQSPAFSLADFEDQSLQMEVNTIEFGPYSDISHHMVNFSKVIKLIPELQVLSLSGKKLGDEGVFSLCEGLKSSTSLQMLNLSNNGIGSQGVAALATVLPSLEALHELDLYHNNLGDEGLISLCEELRSCTSLQKLDVDFCVSPTSSMREILESLPSLQILRFHGNSLAVEINRAMDGSFSTRLLHGERMEEVKQGEHINLSGKSLGDDDAILLSEVLKSCTSIKSLNLSDNGIGSQGVAALATVLPSLEALQELNLYHNKLGDEGVMSLCEGVKSCTTLQKLGVDLCASPTSSMQEILENLPSLQILRFHGNSLAMEMNRAMDGSFSARLLHVQRMEEVKQGEHINLSGKSLGEDDAILLSEVLKSCTSIKSLDLGLNNLGDEGVSFLCEELKSCTSLQKLVLEYNNLTDGCVDRLTFLLKALKCLTSLDLRGFNNNFTESGRVALRQAVEERKGMEGFAEVNLVI